MQRCDKKSGFDVHKSTVLLMAMALVMAVGAQPANAGLFSEMPTDGEIVKVDGTSVIFSEWQEDGLECSLMAAPILTVALLSMEVPRAMAVSLPTVGPTRMVGPVRSYPTNSVPGVSKTTTAPSSAPV